MRDVMQEKFQTTEPAQQDDDGNRWRSAKSVRVKKGVPGREGRAGGDPSSKTLNNAVFYASTPPGMDIEDQELTDQRKFPMRMSSEGDVTPDYSRKAMKTGFTAHKCCPTDDEYTGEHVDLFYAEITVDGDTGFIERGNYLDRL